MYRKTPEREPEEKSSRSWNTAMDRKYARNRETEQDKRRGKRAEATGDPVILPHGTETSTGKQRACPSRQLLLSTTSVIIVEKNTNLSLGMPSRSVTVPRMELAHTRRSPSKELCWMVVPSHPALGLVATPVLLYNPRYHTTGRCTRCVMALGLRNPIKPPICLRQNPALVHLN